MVRRDPGGSGLPLRGRLLRGLAGDRLGRDGGADEALGVLRLRSCLHPHLLRRIALDLEPRRLAVLARDAGLRRLDRGPLPGRARRARRRAPPRSAHREVRVRRQAERDPGPQHGLHDARRDHPLVRLVRVQPRLDAQRRLRRCGLLRVRRAEHEPRGGCGCPRRRADVVDRDQEARPVDDAERRRGRARRNHGGLRLRRSVGRDRDRRRSGRDRRPRRPRGRARADRRPDRRDRRARDGRCLGHALARLPGAAVAGGEPGDRERRALLRRRPPPARRPTARSRGGRRVHVQRVVRRPLADEGDGRHSLGRRGGDGGSRRVGARDVGIPRVLHPGPGRLRDRVARAPWSRARRRRPTPATVHAAVVVPDALQ